MKTTTMIRRSFFLTKSQIDQLTKKAAKLGLPIAELIRRILDRGLDEGA